MIYPSRIKDDSIIYQSMRSTLQACKDSKIESVVIPAFGGLTGGVNLGLLAKNMYLAKKHMDTGIRDAHKIIRDLMNLK